MNAANDANRHEVEPQITQICAERDGRSHAIIGAAMEVHRHLGAGSLEAVYQEALAIEFAARAIPFQREVGLLVSYKGHPLRCEYKSDFLCYKAIIVELKTQPVFANIDQAQVLNYLKATDFELGLLLNFGAPSLEFRRIIRSKDNLRKSAQFAVNQSASDALNVTAIGPI